MSTAIKRIVKMKFRLEEIENFKKIFSESQPFIRNFEECQHVELLVQTDNPQIMFTLSFWDSEQNLEKYRQSELFKTTWAKTKILFAEKPQAWSLIKL